MSTTFNSKYLLVIPVFNEEHNLPSLISRLEECSLDNKVDILFIDGCSNDNSLKIIKDSSLNKLILFYKGKNRLTGQLQKAYKYCLQNNYLGVVTMDGNNKDDPCFVESFIEKLEVGYDYVQGSRFMHYGKSINLPLFRKIMIKIIHLPIVKIASGFKYTDTTQGYRGYSRKLLLDENINVFKKNSKRYQLLLQITLLAPKCGLRIIEVPTTRTYINNKLQTKFNVFSLFSYLYDLILLSIFAIFKLKRNN
jgi:dolichol-phosphate mannosyltransferase